MLRRYGICFAIGLLAVAAASFGTNSRAKGPAQNVHAYKNADASIASVRIKAFYAVPHNKQADPAWQETLSRALDASAKFHALQFHGLSELHYDVFAKPVLLEHDDVFYDTTSTASGNPHALINVGEELERRVMRPSGDLYDASFAATNKSEYAVMAILYEGVGASGGEIYQTPLESADQIAQNLGLPESIIYIVHIDSVSGFFIVNRNYLAKSPLAISGESIFYHEFAHTIGLPDLFDENNAPFSNDVMGRGREKQIENTYIDKNFLKAMGVIQQKL